MLEGFGPLARFEPKPNPAVRKIRMGFQYQGFNVDFWLLFTHSLFKALSSGIPYRGPF